MAGSNPEEIRKSIRVYITVFAALMVLTIITVLVSSFHLSVGAAVALALVIASAKAFLVAGYFMHLLTEKRVIYSTLVLTVVFFLVLMFLPVSHYLDPIFG